MDEQKEPIVSEEIPFQTAEQELQPPVMEPLEPLLEAEDAPMPEPEAVPEAIPEYIPDHPTSAYTAPVQEPVKPAPKKMPKKPLRKRVPLLAKIPLQILSSLLCVVLVVGLLALVLVADLRQLVNNGGINAESLKSIITTVMSGGSKDPQAWHGAQVELLDNEILEDGQKELPFVYDEYGNIVGINDKEGNYIELPQDVFFEQDGEGALEVGTNPETGAPIYIFPVFDEKANVVGLKSENGSVLEAHVDLSPLLGPDFVLPPDFELPDDIKLPSDLTDTEAVIDWIMGIIQQVLGENASVNRENVEVFVKESTMMDYLANKMADAATQILTTGQLKDLLNTQEIVNLVQENKNLIQEQFGVEITEEMTQQITTSVDKVITESNLNQILSDKVQETLNSPEMSIMGYSVQDLMNMLVLISSDQVFYILLALVAALCLLVVAANFYNVPAALTWISIPCMLLGGALSAMSLVTKLPILAEGAALMDTILAIFAPVHTALLITGIVLFVGSILWRIIRSVVYRSRCKAAMVAA